MTSGRDTDKERLSVLEALRSEHELRHERHEKVLEGQFASIDKRLGDGEKRFDKIDEKLGCIEDKISPNPNHRRRETITKIGVPAIGGGSIIALIVYLIERLAGG